MAIDLNLIDQLLGEYKKLTQCHFALSGQFPLP